MAKEIKDVVARIKLSVNPLRIIGALVCFIFAVVANKSEKFGKVRKPLSIGSVIIGGALLILELESNFKPVEETELEFDDADFEDEE